MGEPDGEKGRPWIPAGQVTEGWLGFPFASAQGRERCAQEGEWMSVLLQACSCPDLVPCRCLVSHMALTPPLFQIALGGFPPGHAQQWGTAGAAQRAWERLLPPAPCLEEQPPTPASKPPGGTRFTSCLTSVSASICCSDLNSSLFTNVTWGSVGWARLCGQRRSVKATDRNPIWEACGGGSQLPGRCTRKPELQLTGVRT